jgi:hypothetical protein
MKLIIDLTESELAKLEELTKTSFFGAEIDSEVSDAISELLESHPCEDTLDRIITQIEQAREKDKLCEYPYSRCIEIIKKYKETE